MSIGQRVARLRAGEMTQPELADRSGVPLSTLRSIEQGRIKQPGTANLVKLCNALGVSLGGLLRPCPSAHRDNLCTLEEGHRGDHYDGRHTVSWASEGPWGPFGGERAIRSRGR